MNTEWLDTEWLDTKWLGPIVHRSRTALLKPRGQSGRNGVGAAELPGSDAVDARQAFERQ